MAMKTFAPYFPAPDPNPCDYHLKYARTVDGRYIHFYIDPAYWEVVMDGDDLLLYHDKLLDDSNSSNTLSIQNNKPESSDDKAVARKMTKRQTVSYRFSTVVKNTPTIVYAAGFLPNSYEVREFVRYLASSCSDVNSSYSPALGCSFVCRRDSENLCRRRQDSDRQYSPPDSFQAWT